MSSWAWQPFVLEQAAAEPEILEPFAVRVAFRPFARSRYLNHYAQDTNAPIPPDSPVPHLVRVPFKPFGRNRYVWHTGIEGVEQRNDAGSGFFVVPSWDGYRLARASRFYYQERTDFAALAEPATPAPHLVRVPFRPFRPNRYILTTRRDDTVPPEPPGGPSHPPRGRPFRRDGNLGFEDNARYRRNRYIWNASVETLQLQPADTPTPFLVRVRFKVYGQNRHIFHYYYAQTAPPAGGDVPAWAGLVNVAWNARRTIEGVSA